MLVKSFLSPDQVFPTRGRVLLEAIAADRIFTATGETIYLPDQGRYLPTARIVRGGEKEGLRRGDMAILIDEGREVSRSYFEVFKLILDDDGKHLEIIAKNEVEPVLKEYLEKYRKNPSTHDYQLSVECQQTGEWWSFLCSDVIIHTWDELAHPTYKLEYIPTYMIELFNPERRKFKLHYIAPISSILATLPEYGNYSD
jgi:hypothetical protein